MTFEFYNMADYMERAEISLSPGQMSDDDRVILYEQVRNRSLLYGFYSIAYTRFQPGSIVLDLFDE